MARAKRSLDPLSIPSERRQLEIVAALLAFPHDRPLASELEVDLGELEPVGRPHERLEPSLTIRPESLADEEAPARLRTPARS